MNTPTHVVVSLLCLSRRDRPRTILPITVGAVLPDLPMLVFYVAEKLRGIPEATIWGQAYFDPAWQAFFDTFNSLPIIIAGFGLAWATGRPGLALLFMSMGLHVMGDLPVHREDAHRHLFPLSDWRFDSPVSYWDPAHHGQLFVAFEMALAAVGAAVLARRHPEPGARALVAVIVAIYVAFGIFAVRMWM